MHYVIGDVHGCYDEFMQLLHKIESKDEDAKIILVGDLVDRGAKTMEMLEWAMANITEDGKYQCIRGNHEQMIIEWFYTDFNYWYLKDDDLDEFPDTHYDFDQVVLDHDLTAPDKLRPYVEFLESLPYEKVVDVISANKRHIRFRVVHAWVDFGKDVPERIQRHAHLWTRNFDGNQVNGEIIVHGHTPTLSVEYIDKTGGHAKPGRISYQKNSINVDGGCYCKIFKGFAGRLCAICLETMEEIYSSTLTERFEELYLDAYVNEYPEREEMLKAALSKEQTSPAIEQTAPIEADKPVEDTVEPAKADNEKKSGGKKKGRKSSKKKEEAEKVETIESEEPAENAESVETAEQTEPAETAEQAETAEATERTETTEVVEETEEIDLEATVQSDLLLIHQEVERNVQEYEMLYGVEDEFRVKMLKRLGIQTY